MSWLYVPGLADLSSVSSSPCPPPPSSVTWRGKPTPPRSWSSAWKTGWTRRLSGLTLPPLTVARGVASWIAPLRDSRASRTQPREAAEGLRMTAGPGPKSLGWFAKWTPESSSWKTSRPCLPLEGLSESLVTWPRSGSMRSGMCFQRHSAGRRTCESGSSYLLPTPTRDWKDRGPMQGARKSPNLGTVAYRMMPTPTVGDARRSGSRTSETSSAHPGTSLTDAMIRTAGTGLVLNPRFVEWMMGWPIGWTALEPLETGSSHSKPRQRGDIYPEG